MITSDLLRELETKFSGGITRGLKLPRASDIDPVPRPKSVFDGHRMQPRKRGFERNYAPLYAGALEHMKDPKVIVELGILRGVGLAMWCELFPLARVIGLDVDLEHWHGNKRALVERGAFENNEPEVYRFDELNPYAEESYMQILGYGNTVDLFIDDALHYDDAILKAFSDASPFLSPKFLYIVEDNETVGRVLQAKYPNLSVSCHGAMTVIRPRSE